MWKYKKLFLKRHLRNFENFMKLPAVSIFFKARAREVGPVWIEDYLL
jgi:hypothetical protein